MHAFLENLKYFLFFACLKKTNCFFLKVSTLVLSPAPPPQSFLSNVNKKLGTNRIEHLPSRREAHQHPSGGS